MRISLVALLAAFAVATPAHSLSQGRIARDDGAAAAAAANGTMPTSTGQTQEQNEQKLDWWQTAVIYQIYPRSFKDSNDDGVGDLKGITEKAEYLKGLGVDAVWLSPIYKSPMADFGYDISDFTEIDPTFGTMADFDALQEKLHSLGIRLLLDFVPNHSSDRHPWFEKSAQRVQPYSDYYVWADGRPDPRDPARRLPPNNWLSVFGGSAWQWHRGRRQFYLHQFAAAQPDLNYSNPSVVKDMEAVLDFWLERGVDGFRVDAVPFLVEDASLADEEPSDEPDALPGEYASLRHDRTQNQPANYALVASWRALLDRHAQRDGRTRLMMVEAYAERDALMRYFGDAAAPGAHFPFNFKLLDARNASTARQLRDLVHDWMDNMPAGGWPNWVLGNHDVPRVATRMGPELADAMNMLALLLPGTAVTYNGEELAMEDGPVAWEQTVDPQGRNAGPDRFARFSRDPERTPFQWDDSPNAGFASEGAQPWLPVAPSYRTLNAAAQDRVPVSHLQVYRRLVQLRATPAAQRGALNVQTPSDAVLAFARELSGVETLFVVMNLAAEENDADLLVAFGGELPEFLTVLVPSINSGLRVGQQVQSKEVKLPPKASVVLSTKKP